MKTVKTLVLTAAALTITSSMALAGPVVNVNIGGYLPPPPGVHIYYEGGRPYYRESGRVVYLEKDGRHYKEKRGHAYGHRKHEREGHGNGHGNGHGHGKHG